MAALTQRILMESILYIVILPEQLPATQNSHFILTQNLLILNLPASVWYTPWKMIMEQSVLLNPVSR